MAGGYRVYTWTASGSVTMPTTVAGTAGLGWVLMGNIKGAAGAYAALGYTGSAGANGSTGTQGVVGFVGSAGTNGFTGSAGTNGFTGSAGTNGFTGSQGKIGGVELVFQNVGFNYSVDGFTDSTYPDLTLIKGQLYYFNLTNITSSHPLALRLSSGNTSAVPGTTGNNPSAGVYGNGTVSTIVTYQVPFDAPSTIVYQCVNHSGMIGTINNVNQTGYTGSAGANGSTGTQGVVGFTGSAGATGTNGFIGSQGVVGFVGSAGATGSTGSNSIIQSSTAPTDTTVLWLDKNASGSVSTAETLSPFLLMGG